MKNWLKKQTTEVTAWIGFIGLLSTYFVSDTVTCLLFVFLIAIDDQKATAWVKSIAPWAQRRIDDIGGSDYGDGNAR